MPFYVQSPYYSLPMFATYEASEERKFGHNWVASDNGLYWHLRSVNVPRDPSLPLIDKADIHNDIEGYVTEYEAEQATGLAAPACYDYIRERLGNLFEKEK